MAFVQEDKDNAVKFGKFIVDHAKMDLTVGEMLEFHKLLVAYNTIVKKIDENIMELIKVVEEKKESELPKEEKLKKATK
jgi:hypothetical protein